MAEPQKDDLQEFLDELESESKTPAGAPTAAAAPAATAKKPDLKIVDSGASDDADLEATLGGLKEEPSPESLLDQELEKEIDEAMDTISPTTATEDGTLTLSLSGHMTLKLAYAQNGQHVSIRFEKECLFVSLDNGTEFKIPVKS